MQSFEIEYLVSESLDGVTPNPPFVTADRAPFSPGSAPEGIDDFAEPDDDNIYRFDVDRLGLIDPDFGVGGTFGDRFIVGLWINAPNPGAPVSPIAVVSTRVRELTQEIVVSTLAGQTNFYRQECIFVPQGSLLGLVGFDAAPGENPILFRMHVKCPQTLEEYALLLNSCCCTSLTACEVPTVDDIEGSPVDCEALPAARIITVTGGPFTQDTVVELFNPICIAPGGVSISNITIVDESTLTFQVDCSGSCGSGIRISNGPGCEVIVEDAIGTFDGG